MSKPKYLDAFKRMAAKAHLKGEGSYPITAKKYGGGVPSVELWARCYQNHGEAVKTIGTRYCVACFSSV